MSLYIIGTIESRKRRSSAEVTWNKASGVVKLGRAKIGNATSLYGANGVAIREAKNTRSWFEKSTNKRAPYWCNLVDNKHYPSAWLFKGFRRVPHDAEGVTVKIEEGKVVVSSSSVKRASRRVFGGVETPQHERLVFDLDVITESKEGFGRNGCYTLCFEEDQNGEYWQITFSRS